MASHDHRPLPSPESTAPTTPSTGAPGHHRPPPTAPTDLLHVQVLAARRRAGAVVAEVAIAGELCASTAGVLRSCLDHLVAGGTTTLVANLTGLRLCTSDGVAALCAADAVLRERGVGSVEVVGATGGVRRVLDVLLDRDPSFALSVHGTAGRPAPRPRSAARRRRTPA